MTSPLGHKRPTSPSTINRIFAFVESRKPIDRLLLKAALFLTFVSLGFVLFNLNKSHLVEVPHRGGTFTEAIIGTPRFINPLLAVTSADKDMSALIYAGLMRLGADGTLVNDMAESITMSEDGLTYSVVLKSGLTFHDGTPVTSDDVIFTISRLVDPALKSPLLSSWEGVSLERVSERELNMVLERPYAPFIENLTLGILPKHIWEEATADAFPFSQYNSEPIGSGPYKIERIERSKSGIPESYLLSPFGEHVPPRIENLKLVFYSNESALVYDWKQGLISSVAGLSVEATELLGDITTTHNTLKAPLPRTFAVFFNQNEAPVFRDKAVREALSLITDRTPIINDVLRGNGYAIAGPIPPTFDATTTSESPTQTTLDQAREILRDDGWKFDEQSNRWKKKINDVETELSFKLATANSSALEQTAEMLKREWESIGVAVTVEKYEQVDLTQSVIRPRKFDALLFGTVIGRELDFYPFWHSSQRNDPGLNIALYANIETDSILTEARTETSYPERMKKNGVFAAELMSDIPAIFLYAPSFTYIVPKEVQNITIKGIAEPYERFSSIRDWYIDTEAVWPFFSR
jgi:peptide/nickel transport system substrate-binding protein